MAITAEKEYQHMGETAGAADHDHDLVKELTKRLDGLWHYDQYLANAKGKPDLQAFWTDLKSQEKKNVDKLKKLIAQEVKNGCF